MRSRRWVIAPKITAGFALSFGLLLAAGLRGVVVAPVVSIATGAVPIGALTLLGGVVAALTLAAQNRDTQALILAGQEREQRARAEAARAEEARTLEERARAEEALRLSSEELRCASERARVEAERARRLVESNIVGVFFARGETVTEANDAYLELLGYTRDELARGRVSWRPVIPAEPAPGEAGRTRRTPAPFQRELIRKDGSRVPVLLGVTELGESPREWVCFVIDLTERERTLSALRAAQAQAEAVNLAKDQFLAVLSHELRSPLHAMLGWLSILKKGVAAGRNVDRAVEIVERNILLQGRLVDDLLDVSRIVSHKLVIEEDAVDLAMVVEASVESARPAAEARGVELACALAGRTGMVAGDEKRLRQMVGNLVGNAIKFTPPGGRVSVALRISAGGDRASVEVRDSGAGIPPEFLPHLFERFRLADASNTRSHGGLGLGLAIVKTLTELHGGRVEASSEGVGKGATFLLHLPLRPAPVEVAPASAEVAAGPTDLAGVTVLLLEDDPDGREALCLALTQSGARVHACGYAEAAHRLLCHVKPDVIISDIGMPGENGYAFLRAVRAGIHAHVPALALTGFASKQDREEAAAAGFDDHLAKPVDADALLAKLRVLVRRSGPRLRARGGVAAPRLADPEDDLTTTMRRA